MPKDKYGDRDRYASDALRNIFPKNWKFKSPRDSDSGSEVCQDWIIEILDENSEWTGAEFSIQNKTGLKVRKKHISIPLSVDCLIYLLDKVTRPVLIHGYDIETNKSYWTWLSDWDGLVNRKKWKHQKKVSIQIPKQKLLTLEAVNEIRELVLERHSKHTIRQKYDLENKLNPDFQLTSPIFKNNMVYSTVQPKHPKASINITMDQSNHK
ncbi:MAG: DUF4365 domain-containing protein, partial [Chloroflexota bacterium]